VFFIPNKVTRLIGFETVKEETHGVPSYV
jgi:hypothetical protein